MLPDETEDEILFFGGKDYVALFCRLTKDVKSRRTVFYSSAEPAAPRLHSGEIRHNDQNKLALRGRKRLSSTDCLIRTKAHYGWAVVARICPTTGEHVYDPRFPGK
ncbi:MAG TPA: hypothetical protein VNO32_47305 [Candidatus Acidoferrum sp.]|nr:hypothetical protein [Candidatus Acidoferrum sp.]